MTEKTVGDELPHLVVRAPECSHCGEEVDLSGSDAYCPSCRVQWGQGDWDSPGKPATDYTFDTLDPCGKRPEGRALRFALSGRALVPIVRHLPCILPSGHDSHHLHPYVIHDTDVS